MSVPFTTIFYSITVYLLSIHFLSALTLLLPVQAIEDSGQLSAQSFKQLYPGIDLSGQTLVEHGWYVLYHHEALTYLFGPMDKRADAEQHQLTLESIYRQAVEYRSSLATATIRLYHYPDEPFSSISHQQGTTVTTELPESPKTKIPSESDVTEEKSENFPQKAPSSEPEKFNLFGWIKKVFGW